MTPSTRLCALAIILFGSACHAAPSGSEPKASDGVPGPSPDDEALLCKGDTSTQADVVQFEKGMPHPKALRIEPPKMTEEMDRTGVEGMLVMKCVITKDGSLTDCCILRGINGLNKAVFEAVRTWRYEPVILRGQPINLAYVIPVQFVSRGRTRVVPFPPSQ